MKILLTGATGFIGSHILSKLLEEGHSCVILKRSTSSLEHIQHLKGYTAYDIDQMPPLQVSLQERAVDCIIHSATCYNYHNNMIGLLEADLLLPTELLNVFGSRARIFINTTSYFTDFPDEYEHLTEYIQIKKDLLRNLKTAAEKGIHTRIVNMKLYHVYGPRDGGGEFVPHVIRDLCAGVPSIDLTSAEQIRDFIYVKDVAAAYVAVLKHASGPLQPFSVFNVGTSRACSIRSFVQMAKKISGASTELRFGALPMREHEVMRAVAEPDELRDMGWTPRYSLKHGLTEYISEYCAEE